MTTYSSTLAWQIPWTEEPGRLQSMGSLKVGHDWATSLSFSLSCIGEGNSNPLQCSHLENLKDGGAWWAAIYGVAQSRTRLKWLSSSSSSSVSDKMILQPLHSKYGPWNSSMAQAESMWETQVRAPDQTNWLTGPEGKWSNVNKALALGAKKVREVLF